MYNIATPSVTFVHFLLQAEICIRKSSKVNYISTIVNSFRAKRTLHVDRGKKIGNLELTRVSHELTSLRIGKLPRQGISLRCILWRSLLKSIKMNTNNIDLFHFQATAPATFSKLIRLTLHALTMPTARPELICIRFRTRNNCTRENENKEETNKRFDRRLCRISSLFILQQQQKAPMFNCEVKMETWITIAVPLHNCKGGWWTKWHREPELTDYSDSYSLLRYNSLKKENNLSLYKIIRKYFMAHHSNSVYR